MITMRSNRKHNNTTTNPLPRESRVRQLQKQQQKQNTFRSSIFLPKICSASSVNDVNPMSRCRRSSSEEEPSSPKVGCMGQVKRTNKVVAFPSSLLLFPKSSQIQSKHHNKLKRLFSFKSLTNTPTTCGTHKPRVNNNRVRETEVVLLCRSKKMGGDQKGSLVNLEELDPPLPVVKKKQEEEEEEREKNMSLWKRRSGGAPLKTLRVQVTHPSCSVLIANTL